MASTHIEISTQTRSAAYIRQYVDDVARVVAEGAQLVRVLNATATGGDYTAVETLYGLPAGTGQTVYNLIVGAESNIRSSNTTALITQLG